LQRNGWQMGRIAAGSDKTTVVSTCIEDNWKLHKEIDIQPPIW